MNQLVESTVPHFRERVIERLHIDNPQILKEMRNFLNRDKCNNSHFTVNDAKDSICHYFNINELPSYHFMNQYVKAVYNTRKKLFITLVLITEYNYKCELDIHIKKMMHRQIYNQFNQTSNKVKETAKIKSDIKLGVNTLNLFIKEALELIRCGSICNVGYVERKSSRDSRFYFNIKLLKSFSGLDQYIKVCHYSGIGITGFELISAEDYYIIKEDRYGK